MSYKPMLDAAKKRRKEIRSEMIRITGAAEARGTGQFLASESRAMDKLVLPQRENDEEVGEMREKVRRERMATAALSGSPTGKLHRGADTVYTRNGRHSYFHDLMLASTPGGIAAEPRAFDAAQRLADHAKCVERAMADLPDMFRADEQRALPSPPGMETRSPGRDPGAGGYPSGATGFAVPPLYLIDAWMKTLRAGRATADRCRQLALPPGTDAINLPGFNVGTLSGIQAADMAGVPSRDWTERVVTGPVRTLAGTSDFSMQLLEQSPVAFDEIIFTDLLADINKQLDLQVLTGTGVNGQVLGLLNITGSNAVTFTSGAPTVPLLYPLLGQALSQVAKQRFESADSILMHPSHWWWIASSLDGQSRPLVIPEGGSGFNTVAVFDPLAAEGIAGSVAGVPVVVDANIPTNLGAGTNQAPILAAKMSDVWLYESTVRFRSYPAVLSGVLGLRLQAYEYFTVIPNRYAVSVSVINGTGNIVPAGY